MANKGSKGNSSKKHLQGSLIPQYSAKVKSKTTFLNNDAAKLDAWKANEGDTANVFLSLRLIQHDYQCFSEWEKAEMKLFWGFQELVSDMTWQQVYSSGGKGQNKAGLGYTPLDKKQYPKSTFRDNLSDDITLFELRVDQKKRIHGFRRDSVFYACWLDKDHQICP